MADLETREHELENPEPQNGQDAAIDYEALAAVKTDLAKQREKLPALQLKVAEIEVTMDDVAQVIELWTGVPAVKIKETEYGRLQGLEDALKAHIIGQDEAVHAVAGAIKRARADLSSRHRPASFIFVGPTGVGKTELVKQLASQLFDTVDPLISIDMSEYMEKYAVSRLIGSPPGYVGYDEAGQLTEKVRRHPYSVVLFDEIEKAHPDVMNILLQILDEGKINDAQGRTVDFSNTVICMTSNAGSTDQSGATGFGKKAEVASADRSMKALQEFLRPEFIGRVDEIITFKPLSEEDLEKIAALMLDEYKPGLAAHGITLHYTQPALADIVAESSTKYGARELRRTIRKTIENRYQTVPTTFQLWTSKGSVADFKPTKDHSYLAGGAGEFLRVGENGELKHDTPKTELLPQRKVDTYGRQFSMSRQAFINDDIGFITEVPGLYAASAKRTINKQVYSILVQNPAVFDGVPLFNAAHNNLITAGAKPSIDTMQAIMLKLLRQTDPFGEAITIQPRYIIVPVGYGFLLSQLLETQQIEVSGIGSKTMNPLYNYRNQLQVIEEGTLNVLAGDDAVPWFMVGDPSYAKSIQVDYLNGQETPTIRRSEVPGQLGYVWDIWLDWGITAVDFRGIAKNPGVTIE